MTKTSACPSSLPATAFSGMMIPGAAVVMKDAFAVMPARSRPSFFRLTTTGKYCPVAAAMGPTCWMRPAYALDGSASIVTSTLLPTASRTTSSWETLPCSLRVASSATVNSGPLMEVISPGLMFLFVTIPLMGLVIVLLEICTLMKFTCARACASPDPVSVWYWRLAVSAAVFARSSFVCASSSWLCVTTFVSSSVFVLS